MRTEEFHFGIEDAFTQPSSPVERLGPKGLSGMKASNQGSAVAGSGVVSGAVNWVASSIFGLTGTVLLICWLLAYALEPDGWFARIGLMLALGAYGIDLVREKWITRHEQVDVQAKTVRTPTPSAAKAA